MFPGCRSRRGGIDFCGEWGYLLTPHMLVERTVELGERAYPVWIGEGALGAMKKLLEGGQGVVVTDRNVVGAQGGKLAELGEAGRWPVWVLEPGEGSKAWGKVGELLEFCAEMGLDRGSWLVAFGGGVVGDVTGFAAACWMRPRMAE